MISVSKNLKNNKVPTTLDKVVLPELFALSKWAMLVAQYAEKADNVNVFKRLYGHVLEVNDVEDLKLMLPVHYMNNRWNNSARFIIMLSSLVDYREMVKISEYFWSFNVLTGVMLLPGANYSSYDVYTWYPYTNNCGQHQGVLTLKEQCYDKVMKKNWFANKLPKMVTGCPLKITTVIYPPFVMQPQVTSTNNNSQYQFTEGFEVKMINMAADFIGMKPVYTMSDVPDDWGIAYANGTTKGPLTKLFNGEVEVAIGAYVATRETHQLFEYTNSYFQDGLKFCAPHALEKPHWKKLSEIIAWPVLILGTFTIITLSVITSKLSVNSHERRHYHTFLNCFQNIVAALIGSAYFVQPLTSKIRILMMIWFIATLYITIAFQTYMISSLTKPDYEVQIKSMNEVIDSNYDLFFHENALTYFSLSDGRERSKIMGRYRPCPVIHNCLYETATTRKSITCTPKMYAKFAGYLFTSSNREALLYCFEENIVTYPVEILFREGFAFKNRLDKLIGSINTAGFLNLWERNIYEEALKNNNVHLENYDECDGCLSFEHLAVVFVTYLFFMVIAFMVFVGEIFYRRRTIEKKIQNTNGNQKY